MQEEIKLMTCPFCGGEAKLKEVYAGRIFKTHGYYVKCVTCGGSSVATTDKEETIEKWNRRV